MSVKTEVHLRSNSKLNVIKSLKVGYGGQAKSRTPYTNGSM